MKPPGGGGGHNRTAKDDALVNKQKTHGEPGLQVLRLKDGLLGKTESDDKIQLKTITL